MRAALALICACLALADANAQTDPLMDRFLERAAKSPNTELEIKLISNRRDYTKGRISKETSEENEREILEKIAERDAREAEEKSLWDERRRFEQAERDRPLLEKLLAEPAQPK